MKESTLLISYLSKRRTVEIGKEPYEYIRYFFVINIFVLHIVAYATGTAWAETLAAKKRRLKKALT